MRQGDVVLINFPFNDRSAAKVRPALVISNDEHNSSDADHLFVLISSNTRIRSQEEDIIIWSNDPEFPSPGLRVPSVFRCSKLVNLDSSKLRFRRLGRVGPQWLSKIADAICDLVHPSG